MKKTVKVLSLFLCLTVMVILPSCGDEDEPDINPAPPTVVVPGGGGSTSDNTQPSIVGKWTCLYDAYGDPWDEPLVCQFDADGEGYLWFSDEPFSRREEFSYTVSGARINIIWMDQYEPPKTVRYEMSDNAKNLTIYGFDDDDMEILHFTKE